MFLKRSLWILGAALGLLPQTVSARLVVSTLYAGGITWPMIISNVIGTLATSMFYVALAAFLIGSMMYIMGYINEENKNKGKNLMTGSLMGMAVGLSAMMILNTVLYYLYGT